MFCVDLFYASRVLLQNKKYNKTVYKWTKKWMSLMKH